MASRLPSTFVAFVICMTTDPGPFSIVRIATLVAWDWDSALISVIACGAMPAFL
jgi:hypothetical protein